LQKERNIYLVIRSLRRHGLSQLDSGMSRGGQMTDPSGNGYSYEDAQYPFGDGYVVRVGNAARYGLSARLQGWSSASDCSRNARTEN
jgi:hypothetical protein